MSVSKSNKKSLRVAWHPDNALASCINEHLPNLFDILFSTYSSLEEAAVNRGNESVLLILINPVEDIAEQLATSQDSDDLLLEWKTKTTLLLKSARRLRRHMKLVDARAFLSHDPDTMVALSSFKNRIPAPKHIPSPPSPTALVIANSLLTHDPDASRLVAELKALQHGPSAHLLGKDQVISTHQEYVKLKAGASFAEETQLLQENLKLQLVEAQNREEEVGLLRDNLTRQIANTKKREEENGLLREKNTRLRQAIAKNKIRRQQLRESKREACALQNETLQRLHNVYSSKSWKITAPLRATRAAKKRMFGSSH